MIPLMDMYEGPSMQCLVYIPLRLPKMDLPLHMNIPNFDLSLSHVSGILHLQIRINIGHMKV